MKLQCIWFQTHIRAVRNLCQRDLAGIVALLLVSGAATASAQSLTSADRDRALQYLESTKKSILEATAGLSQAQWNFKPAPDRWSTAQVMEHIAASEDFIRDNLLKDKVMVAPPGEPGRDVKQIDEAVVTKIPDRTHKAQAPEPLIPTNRFGSPDGALKHFVQSRATSEQYLRTATGLREHVMDGPVGSMDGYEFILFIAAHSERHTKQINEVKQIRISLRDRTMQTCASAFPFYQRVLAPNPSPPMRPERADIRELSQCPDEMVGAARDGSHRSNHDPERMEVEGRVVQ